MRLIDADALKEVIFSKSDSMEDLWDTAGVLNAINNAPTVSKEELQKIFYETAEKPELEKASERPQGEWLDEKFVAFHLTCNKCGCNIRRQKEEVFEGDYDYNFCPNCGAKMGGST